MADDLGEAFSSGDGLSIGLIIGGLMLFVFAMWYAGRVAQQQVKMMAQEEASVAGKNGIELVVGVNDVGEIPKEARA